MPGDMKGGRSASGTGAGLGVGGCGYGWRGGGRYGGGDVDVGRMGTWRRHLYGDEEGRWEEWAGGRWRWGRGKGEKKSDGENGDGGEREGGWVEGKQPRQCEHWGGGRDTEMWVQGGRMDERMQEWKREHWERERTQRCGYRGAEWMKGCRKGRVSIGRWKGHRDVDTEGTWGGCGDDEGTEEP